MTNDLNDPDALTRVSTMSAPSSARPLTLENDDSIDAVTVTFFKDKLAREKIERPMNLGQLKVEILTTSAACKEELPWLKLARFGSVPSKKGSLRNDRNVLEITGIEADYDGELIPVGEAVEMLQKAGVRALVYTSPSHTHEAPRWRVLCPTSRPLSPDRRRHLVGRLNGDLSP